MSAAGNGRLPRRLAGRWTRAAAAWALLGALACTAPPPPPAAERVPDYDSPRPALAASFVHASAHRSARGDLEGALRAAQQARAAGPQSAAAELREAEARAALALRDGDREAFADARSTIEALQAAHPEQTAPRIAALRLALHDGQLEEAAAGARALAAERPEWGAPRAVLSEALLEDDPAAALEEAQRAVSLAPSDPDALAARARAHSALAEDTAAADDARRAIRVRPDLDLERLLVHSLLRRGETKRAIERGEAVLEAERSAALELLLARAYWAEGTRDFARAAVARSRTRAGDDAGAQADALELGAEMAIDEHRTGDALAEIETARAAHPDDARLAELAALCQLDLGQLPAAEASARRAVELDAARPSAWETLAGVLHAEGARPPAQVRAGAALGAAADDPRAAALAGLVAERAGDPAAAALAYEAALAKDPALCVAQLRLAALLSARDTSAARAAELAEAARREAGWSRETAETLAHALRASGRAQESVVAYRVAWAKVPPGAPGAEPLILDLAEALEAAGEPAEALDLATSLVGRRRRGDAEPPWFGRARDLRMQLIQAKTPPPSAAAPAP